MGAEVVITLDGTPRGKGRPRFARESGRAFTPAATRSYEAALRLAAQEQMAGRPLLDGPVIVRVQALMPIAKSWSKAKQELARVNSIRPTGKPDWDNLAKVTDALNQVVFADDAQVVTGIVEKRYSDRPALIVTIEALQP